MAKNLKLELDYPAEPAAVLGLLKDAGFRVSVCEAQHATSHTVSVVGETVDIAYTQPVRGLPSFAQKFVGDAVDLVQREIWSGQRADISLTIPGKPGEITGTRELSATDDGTHEVFTLTAKVAIPLLGGKLEELILQVFKKGILREHRTAVAALSA